MVLTEAMAAGTPVVALDAAGVCEAVSDGRNGRLLCSSATCDDFVEALRWVVFRPPREARALSEAALSMANRFSLERCADKALSHYKRLCARQCVRRERGFYTWTSALQYLGAEWEILRGLADATDSALHRDASGK